jgi:hypothetical protein
MATLSQAQGESFERDVADDDDGSEDFRLTARALAAVVALGALAWTVLLAPIFF